MAKIYRLNRVQRLANGTFRMLTRFGLGARYRHILTVRGRTSGLPRATPVDVMMVNGERFLVAPYGEVNWVRNLRVARIAELSRGGTTHRFTAQELSGSEAVPAIRNYLHRVPVTHAYWDVGSDSTDNEIAAESLRHPVFKLTAA